METTVTGSDQMFRLDDTLIGAMTAGKTFQDSLGALRRGNHATSAAASFWWTAGGEDFPPLALASRGLPDPFHYSYLLTGKSPDQAPERG
jgi:type VI secretion system protein ImpM